MALNSVGTASLGTTNLVAGGVTNTAITTSVARPYSLANMDVDSAMIYEALNRKLNYEAVMDSVFENIQGEVSYISGKVVVPDACIMRVSSERGARSQLMPLLNPLSGDGRYGTGEAQLGYERNPTMEYMKIYYNEYSQAVAGENWGVKYNDLQLYNYFKELQPSLSRWFAEEHDKHYHQALLHRYAEPLRNEGAGTGTTGLDELFNPNWFIANTEFGSQPTYSATDSTFRASIVDAFEAAATGTSGVNANLDLNSLLALELYASDEKKIKPVMIGGQPTFIVLLPTPQWNKLRQNSSGQLGDIWTDVTQLSKEEQSYPGVVGRVGCLLICRDPRYPTISCTNDYGDDTISPAYVEPGNNDSRNKSVYAESSNASWDIGFLMGQAAIVDWNVTPLHFEKDMQEYGKKYGHGAFIERGIQLGIYDLDTAGNATKNFGSIVLAFTATTPVTTA